MNMQRKRYLGHKLIESYRLGYFGPEFSLALAAFAEELSTYEDRTGHVHHLDRIVSKMAAAEQSKEKPL